jgi:hypothetical protein
MQQTITLDTQKLLQQIAQINKLAKEKGWEFYYDSQLDSLYYSPETIESHFSLFSISNEFSVYIDNQSNVGGIFIEYYKNNLASHDDKFKPFVNLFTNSRQIPQKKKEKEILLSEVIKAELLSDLINTDKETIEIPTAFIC